VSAARPPIEPYAARFERLLQARLRDRGFRRLTALAGVGAAGFGAAIGFGVGEPGVMLLFAVLFAALALISIYWWARRRARNDAEDGFLAAWGATLDLAFVEEPSLGAATALLRDGDKREASNGLTGRIDGRNALICHYTCTDVSTDSNGHRHETDHDYTLARIDFPGTGLSRLGLRPRDLTSARLFDGVRGTFTRERVIELESSELHAAFRLLAGDDVEDAAVRRVFEPSFMVWCLEQRAPFRPFFELEGGTLVVAFDDHWREEAALDLLVAHVRTVTRYLGAGTTATSRSIS
jgi:hypothetical protein